jgi:hypothetical protein
MAVIVARPGKGKQARISVEEDGDKATERKLTVSALRLAIYRPRCRPKKDRDGSLLETREAGSTNWQSSQPVSVEDHERYI